MNLSSSKTIDKISVSIGTIEIKTFIIEINCSQKLNINIYRLPLIFNWIIFKITYPFRDSLNRILSRRQRSSIHCGKLFYAHRVRHDSK